MFHGRKQVNFIALLIRAKWIIVMSPLFFIGNTFFGNALLAQAVNTFYAPDSSLKVIFNFRDTLSWQLQFQNEVLVERGVIHLRLQNGSDPGIKPFVQKIQTSVIDEQISVPVAYRQPLLRNHFRQIIIELKADYLLECRLYNDGFAYRFRLSRADSITVVSETARWQFPEVPQLWYAHYDPRLDADAFHTSFEGQYRLAKLDTFSPARITYAPALMRFASGLSLLISDANLVNYPGMHLQAAGVRGMQGIFAAYPEKERMTEGEFPAWVADKRAPYLARIAGKSVLPFRAFLVGSAPIDITRNNMLYLLGDASKITDPSWIKAGKGTDEWICGINLFDVPFKAGLNTETYKYYIDFAARFGFDQIMLDAGWSDYKDLFRINPAINMDTLLAYGREKNVRLMLWTLSSTLDRQLDSALQQFEKWGVQHIMTDFMDRDDQPMVQFYHRIAEACAKHKIAVMFHGAFPPKGFNRTWPNAITQEGVLGAEWNIWSELATPAHNVALAFTRMVAGPLDYEPGLLLNAQPDQFRPIGKNPMSIGTRCHQLAMFVVYDSPLQIFSGNPSQAWREPAFMEILGALPTTWDETRYLDGAPGEYILVARRRGADWYIAGMNGPTERTLTLDVGLMGIKNYTFREVRDGVNAGTYGSDYSVSQGSANSETPYTVTMKQGGGFLLHISSNKPE
jgi:alpha-glucosidase